MTHALSKSDLDTFWNILTKRKTELEDVRDTGETSAGTVELDQSRVGRLSRMDALQSQAMSLETNRRREIELQRIEAAFDRMDRGDFGICVSCGNDIHRERLKLDPATPLCLDCANNK